MQVSYPTTNTITIRHDDGSQYIVYSNYNHFKQSGFAAGADDDNAIYGEVHGGATPEEMLVPVIVIDSKINAPLVGTWEKTSVKIMMKKARLSLSFNKPVQKLQLKIAGIDADVISTEDSKRWNAVIPDIKRGTIRVSFSKDNTIEDAIAIASALNKIALM